MSFHTGRAGAAGGGEVYDTLFRDILKVPDCFGNNTYGCLTGDLQNDLIFALIVPHVVLLIYLYGISRFPLITRMHKGLGTLFGATVYLILVYTGWYGILANLLVWWIALTIGISLFLFMFGRLVHPEATGARLDIGRAIGRRITEPRQRERDVERLEAYIRDLERRRRRVENERANLRPHQDRERVAYTQEIRDIDESIERTRNEIRTLRGH